MSKKEICSNDQIPWVAMNKLDKDLEDIMFTAAGGISDMGQEEIAKIKQIFLDAGWRPNSPLEEFAEDYMMSGAHWYKRFEEESSKVFVSEDKTMTNLYELVVLPAAKRASES